MRKSEIQKLRDKFPQGSVIETVTLNRFIDEELKFLNPKSRSFAIFDLTSKNILYQLNATHYKVSSRKSFKTELPQHIFPLLQELGSKYPTLKICAWESKCLNPFLEMQLLKNVVFVEVEKGFESILIERLSQDEHFSFLLKPNHSQLESYMTVDSFVILKTLITKAPTNKKRFSKSVGYNQNYHGDKSSLSTPKVEKIIVDLIVDPLMEIFDSAQRDLIIKNILKECAVNFKTLFSYARNRNKKEFMIDYLENDLRFNIETGEFFDL